MAKNLDLKTIYNIIDNMLTGVGIYELYADRMELLYMNEGAYRMLGYTPEMGKVWVNKVMSMVIDEDKNKLWQAIEDILKDDGAVDVDFRTVTATGSLRWIQVRGNLYSRDEEKAIIICVFSDATDQKFVEEEFRSFFGWYQELAESEGELLFDYNARTDVLALKVADTRGLKNNGMIDRYLQKLKSKKIPSEQDVKLIAMMEDALRIPKSDVMELFTSFRKEQEDRWYRVHITSIAGVDGYVTHIVGRATDIQDQKLLEEQIRQNGGTQATGTGWYDREVCEERVNRILQQSDKKALHAFMILDLNNYANIVAEFGEEKGKKVLAELMERVGSTSKRSDILGMLGGDQFLIFAPNIGSMSNLDIIASRICRLAEREMDYNGTHITITASVGVALAPYHGESFWELWENAQQALYMVKATEKPGFLMYDAAATVASYVTGKDDWKDGADLTEDDRRLPDMIGKILYEEGMGETSFRAILQILAENYGFQRAVILLKNAEGNVDYSFDREGFEPEDPACKKEREWNYLKEYLEMEGRPAVIHNYDNLNQNFIVNMLKDRINTIFIQPFVVKGELVGAFMMAECTGEHDLTEGQEKELKEILSTVQMHLTIPEQKESRQGFMAKTMILDDFDSFVYAVDADTYELQFINRKLLNELPEIAVGQMCYQAIQHRDSPCRDCIIHKLSRENIHQNYSEEVFPQGLRRWVKAHASWLECTPEQAVCLINCMDISEYFMG